MILKVKTNKDYLFWLIPQESHQEKGTNIGMINFIDSHGKSNLTLLSKKEGKGNIIEWEIVQGVPVEFFLWN